MLLFLLFEEFFHEREYTTSRCEFTDCLFTDCINTSVKGGGLYISVGDTVVISRCTFRNCVASSYGGLYSHSIGLNFTKSVFEGCSAVESANAFGVNSRDRVSSVSCIRATNCKSQTGHYTFSMEFTEKSEVKCMNGTDTSSLYEELVVHSSYEVTVKYTTKTRSNATNAYGSIIYIWGQNDKRLSYTNLIECTSTGSYGLCLTYVCTLNIDHFCEYNCEYKKAFVVWASKGGFSISDAVIHNSSKVDGIHIESYKTSGTPYPFVDTDCAFNLWSSEFTGSLVRSNRMALLLLYLFLIQ